jgi:hypothetical protein
VAESYVSVAFFVASDRSLLQYHGMRAPVLQPAAQPLFRPVEKGPAVLLGLFVVWQLVFLVLANALEFIPHHVHRLDEFTGYREVPPEDANATPTIRALAAAIDCWSQLTGQYQMWWLFAPDFPRQATFPAVELRWDRATHDFEPALISSSLEPATITSYFHPPDSTDRLLHYEANISAELAYWNDPTEPADIEQWHRRLSDAACSRWKSTRAYLRWQIAKFLAEHPDRPSPDEARLLIRIYTTPAPDARRGDRPPPRDMPFARWRCSEDESFEFLPIELYDPFSGRYVALPKPPVQERAEEVAHHE